MQKIKELGENLFTFSANKMASFQTRERDQKKNIMTRVTMATGRHMQTSDNSSLCELFLAVKYLEMTLRQEVDSDINILRYMMSSVFQAYSSPKFK